MKRTVLPVLACVAACGTMLAASPAYATSSPQVVITTPDYSVLVGTPVASPAVADVTRVTGTATDSTYAISSVVVRYCGPGGKDAYGGWNCGGSLGVHAFHYDATLDCDATGRSCTWSAEVPVLPDHYIVVAEVTDAASLTGYTDDAALVVVV